MLESAGKTDSKRKVNRKGTRLTVALCEAENVHNIRSLKDQISLALADEKAKTIILDGLQTQETDCSFYQVIVAAAAQAQLQNKSLIVSRLAPNLTNIATLFGLPIPSDSLNTEEQAS